MGPQWPFEGSGGSTAAVGRVAQASAATVLAPDTRKAVIASGVHHVRLVPGAGASTVEGKERPDMPWTGARGSCGCPHVAGRICPTSRSGSGLPP